jgi:nitrous oxidase accessory protein NosD
VSGTGIALLGADDTVIRSNDIQGNRPARESVPFHGGVALAALDPAHAPEGNAVVGNRLCRNQPDIFDDGTGTDNRIAGNSFRCNGP